MENTEILVVGKHEEIMKTIIRLIEAKTQWKGHAAFSVEESKKLAESIDFHVVLLGAGLTTAESDALKSIFTVPVVQHYGGGSGLLFAEIYEAIGK